VSLIDLFPTLAKLAGGKLPDKPLDGVDIWPVLSGKTQLVDRDILMYFGETWPQCARRGKWKLHVARFNSVRLSGETRRRVSQNSTTLPLAKPELYNLELDPAESYDVAPRHPEIVKDMLERFNTVIKTLPEETQRAWAEVLAKKVEPDAEPGSIPLLQGNP
jgi:arylsulfatase A